MPLLNSTIQRLNEITTTVENKNKLTVSDEELIRKIFKEINEKDEIYDVNEIESWFDNEGTWNNKDVRIRITNISHYIQTKYEQTKKFHIMPDDDSCCEN